MSTSDATPIDGTTAPVALWPYWAFKNVKLQLGSGGLTTIEVRQWCFKHVDFFCFEDSGPLYGLKSYVILMGKLSTEVKQTMGRLMGLYVDDIMGVCVHMCAL